MTKSPVKDTDQYVSNLSNNLGKFTTFKKISESRLRGFSKMTQPPWKWDGDDMYGTCCDDKNNKRHILSMPDKENLPQCKKTIQQAPETFLKLYVSQILLEETEEVLRYVSEVILEPTIDSIKPRRSKKDKIMYEQFKELNDDIQNLLGRMPY